MVQNRFDPCRAYLLIFMDEDPLQESEIPVLYTLAAVHHCQFVLGHQLFTTMSSDEFKMGKKIALPN